MHAALTRGVFPFSKPLVFLVILTGVYTFGLSTLASHAVWPPPGQSRGLWTITFTLILTWWVYADRGARNFQSPYEFEYFVFLLWPIAVPYYLYRRLGGRGLVVGLGILFLYFVPFFVAAFVYVVGRLYSTH
jgi:hypothetical protein